MRLATPILFAGLLALQSAAARAEPAPTGEMSPAYGTCMDAAGGVTHAMLDCIHAEIERQDAELNAIYGRAMENLAGLSDADVRREGLRNAERAWIAYRDATCAFLGTPFHLGTFESVLVADCVAQMTAERVRWLALHAFDPPLEFDLEPVRK